MSVFTRFLFTLICLLALTNSAAAEAESVPGQFLIKYKNTNSRAKSNMRHDLGVRAVKTNALTQVQLVEAASASGINAKLAKDLLASGEVEYIEPNYIVHAFKTPNDPSFSSLWGMHNSGQNSGHNDIDIDAPEAWDVSTGSNQVVVGIVDTGVDYTHQDLAANIWINAGEIPDNGIDDDDNGVIDDVHGFNAFDGSGNPMDDNNHGTHVAGTIGARGNDRLGVAGVNWHVKIMPLKFLSASGSGTTQGAIEAIEYAIKMKNRGVNIKVLNNSWGGTGFSQALEDAVKAANNAGILFVAAAGNSAADNDSLPSYPANFNVANVISVAAIDRNSNLASFSNYGLNTVHLAAPGVDILSSTPGNTYSIFSGTSMACPHVAGVAALVLAKNASLSVSQLKSRLLNTVQPLNSLTGLVKAPGIVNANNAVRNIQVPLPPVSSLPSYQKASIAINFDTDLGTRVLQADDGYKTLDLGFSFPYYGSPFSKIQVSANGRILPLANGEAGVSAADYNNSLNMGINPFHDDLFPAPNTADSGIWFKSDANLATITFVSTVYAKRFSTNSNVNARFQAKLYANGKIEFHYLDTHFADPVYDYGASTTVGLAPMVGIAGQKLSITQNNANAAEIGNDKALQFTFTRNLARTDFDGDGRSDIAVWRPNFGLWYLLTSSTGFDFAQHKSYQFGLPGDIPLTGDIDGDGRSDMVVWRPMFGLWYFKKSSQNFEGYTSTQWGLPGDIPMLADHDGDGLSDLVVYRPSLGTFYVLLSSSGFDRENALGLGTRSANSSLLTITLGDANYDILVGDFTGDGMDEFIAVWKPLRLWMAKDSSGNIVHASYWGETNDTVLTCDIDDDDKSDNVVVRRESNNELSWFTAAKTSKVFISSFGSAGDVPNCDKDFDGDGKVDIAVFRPANGFWFIKQSSDGEVRSAQFGLTGDLPL